MAQSKEYSENDFLYSSYTDAINDAYCNKTDVEWNDLIKETCNTFKLGTDVSLKINGKAYVVSNTDQVNTVDKIANEFTMKTPYNFSYNSSKNNLTIDAAKISFNGSAPNNVSASASAFLGYTNTKNVMKLPYALPNKIKLSSSSKSRASSKYAFDKSYNIALNGKVFDIRAIDENPSNIYFDATSLTSGISVQSKTPYINNIQLVNHLNKKKLGYSASPTKTSNDIGNCYYNFDYDYDKDTLIVSDLVLYDKMVTKTTDSETTVSFNVGSKTFTYVITKPKELLTKATATNDIVKDERSDKLRKFNSTLDTRIESMFSTTYTRPKILAPTVKQKIYNKQITGAYVDGVYVFDLNNSEIPTFKIGFDSISGEPNLMCSGSKYIKINDIYHRLPYTKQITNEKIGDSPDCLIANRNKALCLNKKGAQTIMDKTQTHPGFSQQYIDAKGFSDMSVLNLINLGIGIVAAAVFIRKTYK